MLYGINSKMADVALTSLLLAVPHMYICIYVCMYVPEIQPKRYMIAQQFSAYFTHHSPAVCSIKFRSNLATKKIIKKSIPDSVKYSSGEFDQCKQPQRYSSLELSFFYFSFLMIFFYQLLSQREPNGFAGRLVPTKCTSNMQYNHCITSLYAYKLDTNKP